MDGFEQLPSVLHKRACRRILPLTPSKVDFRCLMFVKLLYVFGQLGLEHLIPGPAAAFIGFGFCSGGGRLRCGEDVTVTLCVYPLSHAAFCL